MNILLISLLLIFAREPRIRSINYSSGKVEAIHIKPGLVSKIRFPCKISEVLTPKTKSYHVEISKKFQNELNFSFLDSAIKPLNLIVTCKSKREVVLDLIPSRVNHTDITLINKYNRYSNTKNIISSSSKKSHTDIPKKLIKRSTK